MSTDALLTAPAAPDVAPAPTDDLRAWLLLANAGGLRPLALRKQLREFGSPQAVLAQSLGPRAAI